MPTKVAVPTFKSEREEAQWWDAHPEAIAALFLKAKKEGRIERLPRIRGATKSVTIRMPNADRLEHGEAVPAPMDVSFVAA